MKHEITFFQVDSREDEEFITRALRTFECDNIRISERNWPMERVAVEFERDRPLGDSFRAWLANRGIIC